MIFGPIAERFGADAIGGEHRDDSEREDEKQIVAGQHPDETCVVALGGHGGQRRKIHLSRACELHGRDHAAENDGGWPHQPRPVGRELADFLMDAAVGVFGKAHVHVAGLACAAEADGVSQMQNAQDETDDSDAAVEGDFEPTPVL